MAKRLSFGVESAGVVDIATCHLDRIRKEINYLANELLF